MEIYRRAWIRNGLSQLDFDLATDQLRMSVGEALVKLEKERDQFRHSLDIRNAIMDLGQIDLSDCRPKYVGPLDPII